jgi:hypothetical protein
LHIVIGGKKAGNRCLGTNELPVYYVLVYIISIRKFS